MELPLTSSKSGKPRSPTVWVWRPARRSLHLNLKVMRWEHSHLLHRVSLLFYSCLQLIGWGQPTLWRAICLIHFPNLNVNLIQRHTLRLIQNKVWPSIWALRGPVMLTHKIYHNIYSTFRILLLRVWPVDQQHLHHLGSWEESQILPWTYWNIICIWTRSLGNTNAHLSLKSTQTLCHK